MEILLSGGYILQRVEEDLTYDYLHSSEGNLWSILYLTGYLTKVRKEDFYHAFLAGIFAGAGYMVESNKEHGEGRSDVIVYNPREAKVAVFEAKYAKKLCDMDKACDMALLQINERMYAEEFADDYDEILCYGISFFRKRCRVRKR